MNDRTSFELLSDIATRLSITCLSIIQFVSKLKLVKIFSLLYTTNDLDFQISSEISTVF